MRRHHGDLPEADTFRNLGIGKDAMGWTGAMRGRIPGGTPVDPLAVACGLGLLIEGNPSGCVNAEGPILANAG